MKSLLGRLNAFIKTHRLALALLAGLFLVALVVRLPNLMQVPRFGDDGQEELWALDIALGRRLPLGAGINPYYGPLFAYLLALFFRIFGVSAELPRVMAAVFGALTVVATYGLGRLVWNRFAGIVASGFVLTCPILILYSSHLGVSAALTPFFVTVTLLTFYAANTRPVRGLLALSGLLAALTLQTHPISAVILFGMGLWFLSLPGLGARLRQRELYLALVLFLLGCAPMILNIMQIVGFMPQSVEGISGMLSPTLSPDEYLDRLAALLRIGGFFLGGGIGTVTLVLRFEAIVLEILLLVALIVNWRHGKLLIPLVLVTSILVLPAVLAELNERYFIYLLPPAFVAIGGFAAESWRWLGEKIRLSEQPARLTGVRATIVIGMTGMVTFPLVSLHAEYNDALSSGNSNLEYFRLAEVVQANGACGTHLQVENTPKDFSTQMTAQSWYVLHAVDALLTLDQCEHTTQTSLALGELPSALNEEGWLILTEQSHLALSERLHLQAITTARFPTEPIVFTVILDRVTR